VTLPIDVFMNFDSSNSLSLDEYHAQSEAMIAILDQFRIVGRDKEIPVQIGFRGFAGEDAEFQLIDLRKPANAINKLRDIDERMTRDQLQPQTSFYKPLVDCQEQLNEAGNVRICILITDGIDTFWTDTDNNRRVIRGREPMDGAVGAWDKGIKVMGIFIGNTRNSDRRANSKGLYTLTSCNEEKRVTRQAFDETYLSLDNQEVKDCTWHGDYDDHAGLQQKAEEIVNEFSLLAFTEEVEYVTTCEKAAWAGFLVLCIPLIGACMFPCCLRLAGKKRIIVRAKHKNDFAPGTKPENLAQGPSLLKKGKAFKWQVNTGTYIRGTGGNIQVDFGDYAPDAAPRLSGNQAERVSRRSELRSWESPDGYVYVEDEVTTEELVEEYLENTTCCGGLVKRCCINRNPFTSKFDRGIHDTEGQELTKAPINDKRISTVTVSEGPTAI